MTILTNLKDINRFLIKVKQTNNCWIWTAWKDKKGYGGFQYNGKTTRAHRFSYELFVGEIPQGLQLDHLCRNPTCVNPEHLEVVTIRENVLRGDIGNNHPNSKKTHCPKGHLYSGSNLIIDNNGSRRCKKCRLIRNTIINASYKHRRDFKNKGVDKS